MSGLIIALLQAHNNVNKYTSSLSFIKGLTNVWMNNLLYQQSLAMNLMFEQSEKIIMLLWVPSNLGIKGNERADVAKAAVECT